MKVLRSTFVAAVAIFAAACGDKVTVAGPTAVTLTSTTTTTTVPAVAGKVNSVSIAPATATLTIGQTITMIAAVNADAGVATTVTWTSSDATKASVSTAGLVTALVATPGVAICATSTANTGVKGCGSVVVTAASAVIPATATIAGAFQGNLTTILDPTNVTGRVNVQVNISTGTEVVSKVYLLLGTTAVDSQNFSAAQSASLRYAGENAGAANDVSQPTILLTVNTAAYNATTGAVSFANATGQALSVQLYTVGTTAARSTAKYSSTLTLNNTDAVYGSWTLPSTKVQAADAAGYQWTSLGGGTMTLDILPVIFSGKTLTSATVKYTNFNSTIKISCASRLTAASTGSCYSATAFGDTASVKTVTTLPGSASFTLYDRDMTRGTGEANVITPPVPTISLIYSDGSTKSDTSMVAKVGSSLALRIDNMAPLNPTVVTPLRGSLTSLRSTATWTQRPGSSATAGQLTDADSSALITQIGADGGVSSGAIFLGDLRGITYRVYASAGSTSSVDTASVNTTAITAASALTEGSFYCIRVVAADKLGNSSLYPDQTIKTAGTIITTTCPTTVGTTIVGTSNGGGLQTRYTTLDNTAPVLAWVNNGLQYSMVDTAVTVDPGASAQYYWSITDANPAAVTATAKTTLNVYSTGSRVASCVKGTLASNACGTWTPTATNSVYSLMDANTSASIAIAATGQTIITVGATDAAGNAGTAITRVVVRAATAPTVTTPAGVNASLGADITMSTYGTDPVAVSAFNANMDYTGAAASGAGITAIFPADFSTTGLDARIATTSYTKFLNVALAPTVTAAPSVIAFQPDAGTTASLMSGTSYLALAPTFGVYAAGPSNLIGSAGAVAVSYADQTAAGGVFTTTGQSLYVGAGSGLDYGNALAVSTTSTNIGPNTLAAASTTTSATFSMSYSYYRLQTLNEATVMGTTYLQSKNFCQQARSSTSLTSVWQVSSTGTVAATPYLATTAAGVPATSIQSNNAPTVVDAYVTVTYAGNKYLLKVGTATKVSTATTAVTAATGTADCAQVVTDTWSYSFTPGAQRSLLTYYTAADASNLYFAIKASSGREWLFSAASTAWTYRP